MDRPSPLQNRVAPDGSLHAVPERGALMGNRGGRLHGPAGRLGRSRWRSRTWIACRLEHRGRHRDVWETGYTELFFLDEATALAAGHRPCFECRRAAARAFAGAWARCAGGPVPAAAAMDAVLHHERTGADEPVVLTALPAGAMFRDGAGFFLRTPGGARLWSFGGYGPDWPEDDRVVMAVTPASIRAALAAGYRPALHPSAQFSAR